VLVTNARHADCLRRALASLEAALAALAQGRSEEFLAVDVRAAIGALDELIGGVTTDDVLNAIFSRFCIGK
jgi:tRNA modification GTPase